jgi:hypothetical protein
MANDPMADPHTGADAPTERRQRRSERKQRRIRRVVASVAAVALAVAFVLLATDTVRFSGDEKPSLAATVHAGGAEDGPATVTTTVAGKRCRTLSATDPLRLWVGGDSLAGSLGPALGAITGATGVVQPYFDSRVSSGLADPGFFDWPDHATTEMARLDPEVVVFIIGTNDYAAVGDGNAWQAGYTAKVDSMMKTLIGPGRTVYWIGAPTLKDQKMDAAAVEVNAIAQEVAKQHPEVQYVDAHKLFAGSDGTFSYDLPDETGKVVTMRAGDGVHLTMDGAAYLARTVYKLVDTQCDVTAQKVDGATKQTIETEGSTQVAPGSGSSSGSGYSSGGSGSSSGSGYSSGGSGSSGGTVATTPPAPPPSTAPPTTAPAPVTDPPATTPTTAPPPPVDGATSQ